MSIHNTISQNAVKSHYVSHNLPHLFDLDKPIFITYRLKFTLPRRVILEYEEQKSKWLADINILPTAEKLEALKGKDGLFFSWFDDLLERSTEVPKILHRSDITDIIANSFTHFDGLRYKLLAYCIMSNHVHVLIIPQKNQDSDIYSPARITYTWKRYTANLINAALARSGSLWQQES